MVEIIDIVDENTGLPTGKTAAKEESHASGFWRIGAHIWICNSKGEVLLQKRAKTKFLYPGKWDVSVAGHCHAGEKPINAAIREAREELGLKINKNDLVQLIINKVNSRIPLPKGKARINGLIKYLPKGAKTMPNRSFDHAFLFKAELPIKSLKIQKKETEKLKYVPVEKFIRELNDSIDREKYVQEWKYFKKAAKLIKQINVGAFQRKAQRT